MRMVSTAALSLAFVIGVGAPLAVADDAARVSVTLKDHKFSPAEPTAPAGKPIIIDVSNLELDAFRIREQDAARGKGCARRREDRRPDPPARAGPLSFL